jgi:serine/threonine protein kinase
VKRETNANDFAALGQQVTCSQFADINQKIDEFADAKLLMSQLKPYFDKVAGESGRLNFPGALKLFAEAGINLIGYPMGARDLNEAEFMRFDFDGDGTLSFTEAAKCFRHNTLEVQKRIRGKAIVPVPSKSPEQAGYQVIRMLASGGQGSTALAKSSEGTQVALKIYDKRNANAGGIEELRSEMEVMKSMKDHPHIMDCIEIFQDAHNFYCVNELLPGGDLTRLRENAIQNRISLSEPYFRRIFQQCICALDYMHRNAMMHCDIKEPNIMFKTKEYADPVIVLIDFGMTQNSAGQGLAGGTPGYRPPETNATNIWFPRGDIFSMGVVFFQLLADKTPNEEIQKGGLFTEGAKTIEQVIYFVKTREPPWPLITRQFPGVMAWLPMMLRKELRSRPKAPILLQEPWFRA